MSPSPRAAAPTAKPATSASSATSPSFPPSQPPRVCFQEGDVDVECEIPLQSRILHVGTTVALKGCADRLTCLPPIGSWGGPNESRSNPDAKVCSLRTGEGEPCARGWCGEGLGCIRNDGIDLCRRLGRDGDACNIDSLPCARETPSGLTLVCATGTFAAKSSLGAVCDEGKTACPADASCAQTAAGERSCLVVVRAGRVCDNVETTCRRKVAALVLGPFSAPMGGDTRCDAGICADVTAPGARFQTCGEDADCSPSGRACGKAQDSQRRCLNAGVVGNAYSFKRG